MNVAKYLILLLSTCLILVQADCNKSNDTNHTLSCNPIKQQTAYVTVRAPLPNTTYGNQVFSENYCVEFQTGPQGEIPIITALNNDWFIWITVKDGENCTYPFLFERRFCPRVVKS